MKKYEIVKKNKEFNEIINSGKYMKNKFFVIYFIDSENSYPRFGLAVSKKCGNAVIRNKLKRQLKFILDNKKNLFKNGRDYIIMVKKEIVNISFKEMNESLIDLILKKGKINEKN